MHKRNQWPGNDKEESKIYFEGMPGNGGVWLGFDYSLKSLRSDR